MSDGERRDELRRAGRELIAQRHGVGRMRAQYDAEYRRLLG
jgi:hypothetical protein